MNNKLKCTICPRECQLAENQTGFCKARKNIDGKIIPLTYAYTTGLALDPMEKKPLYHFYPTRPIMSFGTIGCNMGCKFCQNWTTSKANINEVRLVNATPEMLVRTAITNNCKFVAFTYNDPIVFYEYAIDTAKLCQANGIQTVAVTAGYINPEPRIEFFKYMNAANIDLKGFSEEFYNKNCLAHIDPILDTIKYVKQETDCHLELTTLLIEHENTSDDMLKKECEWILNNLGDTLPLHFSAFHPAYKFMNYPATSKETLLKAYNIAKNMGLKYVYIGNVINVDTSTTYCKNCGKPLIVRDGFRVLEYNLVDGNCKYCKTECDGKF